MASAPDSLPNDVEALKAALIETRAKLSGAEALIEHLQLVIAKMKREKFGPRSERSQRLIDQMELQLEELAAAAGEDAARAEVRAARTMPTTTGKPPRPCRSRWRSCRIRSLSLAGRRMAVAIDLALDVEQRIDGPGAHFSTEPFAEDTEFTGFIRAKLWVSSSTADMDVCATIRAFDDTGKEVIVNGAHEMTPVTKGWLRCLQRKLDPKRSTEWRPFHAHDEVQKLTPGEIYEIDVAIWPTSFVFPKGYRMVLSIMGTDFEFDGIPGRILHNHPKDRSGAEFSGINRVLTGGDTPSHVVMPFIPANR